jgi:3-oxoacyl-[acyl-carrier-protein] synthase II
MGFICFKNKNIRSYGIKRVVVTGLGALTLLEIMFKNIGTLLLMVSVELPNHHFDRKIQNSILHELKNFNVEDFIDRKEARKMDRYAQYAMVSSEEDKDAILTSRIR